MVEMVVAIGVMGFIFSFLGYLSFFTARNFAGVHEQVLSQVNASNVSEQTANRMRNAAYFSRFPADPVTMGALKRVKVAMPLTGTAVTTSVLAYHTKKNEVHWYDNENAVTFDTDGNPQGTPSMKFEHIRDFRINYESMFRAKLTSGFTYRGFAKFFANPGNPQYGEFNTDVIAKNHFLDKGESNYAADPTTSGPATL
jgi:hypothetical protein